MRDSTFNYFQRCENISQFEATLAAVGIAIFRLRSADPREFLDVCNSLGTMRFHPDSGADGYTDLLSSDPTDLVNGAGFGSDELRLHTDRSSSSQPPGLMAICCVRPAVEGGTSTFLDGQLLYSSLRERNPELLKLLCSSNSVAFGSGKELRQCSVFSEDPAGLVRVRFRADRHAYFSSSLAPHLEALLAEMNRLSISTLLSEHDFVAVQNDRWMHGRTKFDGTRHMRRALLDPRTGSPVRPGFRVVTR